MVVCNRLIEKLKSVLVSNQNPGSYSIYSNKILYDPNHIFPNYSVAATDNVYQFVAKERSFYRQGADG